MKLKIQDVLKLEKLELQEAQGLLCLLNKLSENPKSVFQITKSSVDSDIALLMLKRKWLCKFTINGCKIEPKKKGFLIDSWKNIRSKPLSFRDHEITPSVAHYREEGLCLSVFDKHELFYCLAMSEENVPKVIIEYMGIRPIFGDNGNFVNKLNTTIQTIGHIVFSSENKELRWNQSEAIEQPIFSQFLTQDFERSFHINSPRYFKNALREIIPIECRKRANRKDESKRN